MPDERVFNAFNFEVRIPAAAIPGAGEQICQAAFAECDGLEATMEAKSFHQGGQNTEMVHLSGPITYGQLTLKRGMSKDFGLWRWFNETLKTERRGLRLQVTVLMLGVDRLPQATFQLRDCLPVKLRASALNAKDGGLAIEEMQIVYAGMDLKLPG